MEQYLEIDPWNIIETEFRPEKQRESESIFSLGNGMMGQRANFEEQYSGDSLRGSYIAGVYYPDKTKVGWWKIGYPEYFAKVVNSVNWIGIDVEIDGEPLDLAQWQVTSFKRLLNMKEGYLERTFTAENEAGKEVMVRAVRFLSMADKEAGAIRYSVTPTNFEGVIRFIPYLNADVENEDANWDEKFWDPVSTKIGLNRGYVTSKTKKTEFHVTAAMEYRLTVDGKDIDVTGETEEREMYVSHAVEHEAMQGQTVTLEKYVAVLSSLNHPKDEIQKNSAEVLDRVGRKGFDLMMQEQAERWTEIWDNSDIIIEGDAEAQQGIRFNIFQLNQTYTGEDERLNIGPKGFTGEKYGGVTYWDTEAYALPFYLCTAPQEVARNLLLYRYRHLEKAIENAEKLGFGDGAALYPMVTINGEECHNEWEITFEEIHRNGAMVYAIYNYIRHTGDREYMADYGLEVLIGVARFWSQRITFSEHKQKYVMLGVTGPNEYENNVNNNWYTNYLSNWCLRYTIEMLEMVKQQYPEKYETVIAKTGFDPEEEVPHWKDILARMYFPRDDKRDIYLQQELYLDKEQRMAADLDKSQRPINQHWSWDRILRSCFIKQPDTLMGMYLFEDHFDIEVIKRHFDFYEPRTVHESSLSPCVHSIQAARLGYEKRAYELYLRTARLDLDDYNEEVDEGLHITSMAGTWMSIVEGFAGKRVTDEGRLSIRPMLPSEWEAFEFKILYRDNMLKVRIDGGQVSVHCEKGEGLELLIYDELHEVTPESPAEVNKEEIKVS
ncbi:MAG: family 65 glycosyl hydrolase domain-containing protein [Balneolaceae bacterium]|nr:family 65 glycosyl hydrolase domain-containing protein [Balneolaceae bacterium]